MHFGHTASAAAPPEAMAGIGDRPDYVPSLTGSAMFINRLHAEAGSGRNELVLQCGWLCPCRL